MQRRQRKTKKKTFSKKLKSPLRKRWLSCWSLTSILHKPTQKWGRQSNKTLHLATCKFAGRAWARCNGYDCKVCKAETSTRVSAAVPDAVWIIYICQSEFWCAHSTRHTQRQREIRTLFPNLSILKIWCKYLLLCSITLRQRGGLALKETVIHPGDPNSSPHFWQASSLLKCPWAACEGCEHIGSNFRGRFSKTEKDLCAAFCAQSFQKKNESIYNLCCFVSSVLSE